MSDYQAKWQEFNKLRRQYLLAMLAGAVALALGAARDFSDNAMNTLPPENSEQPKGRRYSSK